MGWKCCTKNDWDTFFALNADGPGEVSVAAMEILGVRAPPPAAAAMDDELANLLQPSATVAKAAGAPLAVCLCEQRSFCCTVFVFCRRKDKVT